MGSNMQARGAEQHRIVIVGGGVAGIELASALGRRSRRSRRRGCAYPSIILVDEDVAHVWKPMLHTLAAGTRDISQQQTPYIAEARESGFQFHPGSACGLERAAKIIQLAAIHAPDGRLVIPERRLGYDTLVIAVGSQANDFGTPGVAEHCLTIDSRRQADGFNRELRLRMAQCLAQGWDLPVAIVGGGATGVELAAELVQLTDALAGYGGGALARRMTITLLEAGARLLAGFPQDISAATQARLEALGIRVLTQAAVSAADADGFMLADGRRVPGALKVWAAGVKAPDFLANFDGLETSGANRLAITPRLCTTRDPSIFAVGDCASLTPSGARHPLPTTAQVAHQQAQHLIRHLPDAIISGRPLPEFTYHDFGSLVSLADYDAFGSLGAFGLLRGVTIRGRLAHFSHVMLYRGHQARLHGFWRGGLLWLIDWLNRRVRAPVRLD